MKLIITRKMFLLARKSFILRANFAQKFRIGGLELCTKCTVSSAYMMMTPTMLCQNPSSEIRSAFAGPVRSHMIGMDPVVQHWQDIHDDSVSDRNFGNSRVMNTIFYYPPVVSTVTLSNSCLDASEKRDLLKKKQSTKLEKAPSIRSFKMIQSHCRSIWNRSSALNVNLSSRNKFSQLINFSCSHQQHLCRISTTSSHSQVDPSSRKDAENRPQHENKTDEPEDEILKSKKKIWEQNIWTIPNFLTVSRICLTPYLGYLVVQQEFAFAGGLFIFAGFTDMLDGHIARTWPSQKSAFGSALDPLADKILISTLYITLSVVDLIPMPLTALIFARDVCLIGAAFYVRYLSLPPPLTLTRFFDGTNVTMQLKPTTISKVNTAIQLGLVCVTLAAPVFNYVDHALLHALWYITAGTTVWSGLGYAFRKDTYEIYKTKQEAKTKYK